MELLQGTAASPTFLRWCSWQLVQLRFPPISSACTTCSFLGTQTQPLTVPTESKVRWHLGGNSLPSLAPPNSQPCAAAGSGSLPDRDMEDAEVASLRCFSCERRPGAEGPQKRQVQQEAVARKRRDPAGMTPLGAAGSSTS